MMLVNKPFTFDRVVRIILAVAGICSLIWLLGLLSDVLIPFAVALLLTYMMNPLVLLIQKKIPNRTAAVFIALFIVTGVVAFVFWLIIPLIIHEVSHIGRILSDLASNTDITQRARQLLPPDLLNALKDYAAREEIQEYFKAENFWSIIEAAARKVLPGVWGVATGVASFLMGIVGLAVIGLYLVFLLIDYQKVSAGWKELIPPSYRESVVGFVTDFESAMNSYFRGQAAVAAIVGILFALGFFLIGLPLGILMGLFTGLLNMVPYLQLIALIPAFLLSLASSLESGTSLWIVLGLTGSVFFVVQVIQDTILVPKIMGKVTGLNPAMILLSLSVWGKLLGVFGLIIALPMTFLLLVYYRRYLEGARNDRAELSSADK
ncbi:MAG: AI-2E family transporter [Deltaproteobacteria bacterium]|nr:AI-2E family transporter [Deltaproteobacteria bacterium]